MTTNRAHPDQLNLFAPVTVPERFRIDDDTKRRGLRHVAELKALLEARHPTPSAGATKDRVPLGARAHRQAA